MAASLKSKHNFALGGLLATNLLVFYALLQNEPLFGGNWAQLISNVDTAVPACIGLALTGILNAQFSPDAKARIVFLCWNNPLPGSEAFTRYIQSDSRIDATALKKAYGPFPTDPHAQNTLWYKLYKSVDSDSAVMQVHSAFLFSRDYTSLSLLLGVALGLIALAQFPSVKVAFAYLWLLTLHFELARRAANNHGVRFVTTVLALKSAGR